MWSWLAIFAPPENKSQANEPIESGTYDIPVPPALELTQCPFLLHFRNSCFGGVLDSHPLFIQPSRFMAAHSQCGHKRHQRRRTVYRLTPHGEKLFVQLLEETGAPVDQERFSLRLAFFRYLDPETRLALLERRRAYLQEKLAQFKANLNDYKGRMDRYSLSLQSHDMAATQNDIAWIDELIISEKEPDNHARTD